MSLVTLKRRGIDEEGAGEGGDHPCQFRVLLRVPVLEQVRETLFARARQTLQREMPRGCQLEGVGTRGAWPDQAALEQDVPRALERSRLSVHSLCETVETRRRRLAQPCQEPTCDGVQVHAGAQGDPTHYLAGALTSLEAPDLLQDHRK